MKKCKIIAVFWEDHIHIERSQMIDKPSDAFVVPTLSVGILYKEDDKALILISDIERYEDRDEASYTVILKSTIVNRKVFGNIKLRTLR